METNSQNRTFTISAKASATQKAGYIQEANKYNLSLSEWMVSTLDMAINVYGEVNEPTSQIKQYLEKIRIKDEEISRISSDLEAEKFTSKVKQAKIIRQAKTILELKTSNLDSTALTRNKILESPKEEVKNEKKSTTTNNISDLISGAAIIISAIALGRK